MNWYVVFVKTAEEEKIRDFLLQQGLDSFVPKRKMVFRKQGVSSLIEKVIFPGYLFVESEMDQVSFNEKLWEMKGIKSGIVKLLRYDRKGEISALYPEEKEYLEKLLGKNKVLEHSTGLIRGNRVIINEGPLQGFESKIVKIDRHKRTAILELPICGNQTRVTVSLEIVEKIN